jgi:hypothetical protein
MVHERAVLMADEAYNSGQPFMDGLVAALLARGANTPAQHDDWLRRGLIQESLTSAMLTDHEREQIWHRYHVPQWKRIIYRLRVHMIRPRVR